MRGKRERQREREREKERGREEERNTERGCGSRMQSSCTAYSSYESELIPQGLLLYTRRFRAPRAAGRRASCLACACARRPQSESQSRLCLRLSCSCVVVCCCHECAHANLVSHAHPLSFLPGVSARARVRPCSGVHQANVLGMRRYQHPCMRAHALLRMSIGRQDAVIPSNVSSSPMSCPR